jgi:hypothetical protein
MLFTSTALLRSSGLRLGITAFDSTDRGRLSNNLPEAIHQSVVEFGLAVEA